ncbi:uncharacterized protein BX663DRAFT_548947 [Cokeromyces recurvatus]|uniref:uncharacterized protein n=1 Tax=Cokeromyces recurvatus TaxID=90255 RepID=UPI0022200602|nr:uncharacterized protein BX663DRAFT_548947 [Cokeromyces recurvatus]KAI7906808.1 hypothetical protein BX663DRAFT_548947 [Cokeromyces recurvatus]
MVSINKATIIAKEIDTARCKGNWQAIPELARRYKKHNPNDNVLEQSILAEANLNNIIQTSRGESKGEFAQDSPNSISLATRVDSKLLKPVQQQLAAAISDKNSSSEVQLYKQMAKVILARSYFESGDYQRAIEIIYETAFKKSEIAAGYSFVIYLQFLSIKGMTLDLLEKKKDAIEAYEQLASVVNESSSLTDRVAVDWVEEGLYRGILLALSDSYETMNTAQTMNLIRIYQKTCLSQPNTWRTYKRIVIVKYSLKYISTLYRQGQYQPPIEFTETEEGKQTKGDEFDDAKRIFDHQSFSIEIMQLHTTYEKLVYAIAYFPRSGQLNSLVLDFVNRLAEDLEIVGSSESEIRGFIEVLNRAALRTFNSPCIMRHLFHSLYQLGDYEEAQHALHTYLYLVGLESKALIDMKSTTNAVASDAFGYLTPVPITDEKEELALEKGAKKLDGPERSQEKESIQDQINVLLAAVKMYSQELLKGPDAVHMAELAEHVYSAANHEEDTEFIQLGAQIYLALGVAFGFLANQTVESDYRPKFHEKALKSLKKSLAMDDQNWKTYYQTALQLAEMRDIFQAIQMITRSLNLNAKHVPSWHLLALLCSCPVKGDLKQSLKIIEVALAEASPASVYKEGWVDYTDEVAYYLTLHMTQILLIDHINGPEAAISAQEALFQIFGKIVVPELIPESTSSSMLHEAISNGNNRYGMVLSGSLGNMSMNEINSNGNGTASNHPDVKNGRDRSASNASNTSNNSAVKIRQYQIGSRARSFSSFTGRKLHLAEMFSSNRLDRSDINSISSLPNLSHTKNHASKLGLLDPKNLIRKHKKEPVAEERNTLGITGGIEKNGSLTSILSTAPSIMSNHTLLQSTIVLTRPTLHARLQHQRSCKMLCDLWLLSAETYLRLGKLDEALKAVTEAENIDWTTHSGVWCLLGRIYLAKNMSDKAIKAFQKGLVTKPNDIDCRIWLAKTYIEMGHLEVAESLLQAVTQGNGWDCPTAWFYLSEIYKQTDRLSKTKDCLFYALELENTSPIRPFSILPRFI